MVNGILIIVGVDIVWLNHEAGKQNWVPFWHLELCRGKVTSRAPRFSIIRCAHSQVFVARRLRDGFTGFAPR
jgi:hypothetical protein